MFNWFRKKEKGDLISLKKDTVRVDADRHIRGEVVYRVYKKIDGKFQPIGEVGDLETALARAKEV